jgi:hypothetical protein
MWWTHVRKLCRGSLRFGSGLQKVTERDLVQTCSRTVWFSNNDPGQHWQRTKIFRYRQINIVVRLDKTILPKRIVPQRLRRCNKSTAHTRFHQTLWHTITTFSRDVASREESLDRNLRNLERDRVLTEAHCKEFLETLEWSRLGAGSSQPSLNTWYTWAFASNFVYERPSVASYINAWYFLRWSCIHGERPYWGISMAPTVFVNTLCILTVANLLVVSSASSTAWNSQGAFEVHVPNYREHVAYWMES